MKQIQVLFLFERNKDTNCDRVISRNQIVDTTALTNGLFSLAALNPLIGWEPIGVLTSEEPIEWAATRK